MEEGGCMGAGEGWRGGGKGGGCGAGFRAWWWWGGVGEWGVGNEVWAFFTGLGRGMRMGVGEAGGCRRFKRDAGAAGVGDWVGWEGGAWC